MRVVYGLPADGGWHPITHMVQLLVRLLSAELVIVPLNRPANAWRAVAGTAPRRRGSDACLVVAAEPRHLTTLFQRHYWLRGYARVAGWVIDSFWIERIPAAARRRGHFDQLFVTDKELVDVWGAETGLPVSWLPWGADVLSLGSNDAERPVDLQRIGRQPAQWEDDEQTARLCAAAGLRFQGRPPMHDDATANQVAIMRCLSRAKFVLAFSNSVSPTDYTHPTREYLTGRWTDALASGAVVAGIAPSCASADELLWRGATLELESTDPRAGIEQIAAAARSWEADVARENHRRALQTLDWRWRFRELAQALGITSERLDEDLASITAMLR